MMFSKQNMRKPSRISHDPMAAAASLTDDHNISALARLIGKSEKTLAAKLNNDPEYEHHNLHLAEAVAVTELTGDERILKAWANSRGYSLVKIPEANATDDEFSDLLLKIQESGGAVATAILKARQDGVINELEYAGIHRKILAAIELHMQLDGEIKSQVREYGVNDRG